MPLPWGVNSEDDGHDRGRGSRHPPTTFQSVPGSRYTASMPIRRLALPEAGFEVSWDAEALEVVLDTSDERLAEAISSFVDSPPAAALLLVSVAGRGEEGRAGEPPFIFLATDRTPTTPDAFATWDWCAVTSRYAARCVERHGATQVMGYQEYWHSFPMLQLA